MIGARMSALAALLLALTACGEAKDDPAPRTGTAQQESGQAQQPAVATPAANETMAADGDADAAKLPQGTPLEERVATLGLLNKRNNVTVDITLKPGEQQRVDDVLIKLESCERRPPWDPEPETGAFVQVSLRDPGQKSDAWKRVFSGWLFLNSPSLNVVENPIYDVWVKDCAMRFPGEDAPDASAA